MNHHKDEIEREHAEQLAQEQAEAADRATETDDTFIDADEVVEGEEEEL